MRTLVALAAALLAGTASADTTLHYTVLFQGEPAGAETAIVHADGRVDVEMSYRNNGRGPDIHEHSRFGADGTLVSFDVKGKSTFGAPISEGYTLKGGQGAVALAGRSRRGRGLGTGGVRAGGQLIRGECGRRARGAPSARQPHRRAPGRGG